MSKEVNITENKKILIKPIDKDRPFFKEGHDGRIRYSGCNNTFTLPWKTGTRSYVKIFADGEQEAFEQALDLEPGTLNIYKRKDSWWSKFFIELDKNEKELDLSAPMQSLEYRVLKANKDNFAASKGEYNGTQDYYLLDLNVEEEISYKSTERNILAMELFMKMRKSNKKMFDVIRIMGLKPPKTMLNNNKALEAEIMKTIQQVEKITGMPNIDTFIAAAEDKLYSEKVFVLDAIDLGEIELKSDVFRIAESGLPVGRSLQEVAEFFGSAKNQEDKLLIQRRIELNN